MCSQCCCDSVEVKEVLGRYKLHITTKESCGIIPGDHLFFEISDPYFCIRAKEDILDCECLLEGPTGDYELQYLVLTSIVGMS